MGFLALVELWRLYGMVTRRIFCSPLRPSRRQRESSTLLNSSLGNVMSVKVSELMLLCMRIISKYIKIEQFFSSSHRPARTCRVRAWQMPYSLLTQQQMIRMRTWAYLRCECIIIFTHIVSAMGPWLWRRVEMFHCEYYSRLATFQSDVSEWWRFCWVRGVDAMKYFTNNIFHELIWKFSKISFACNSTLQL